MKYYAVKVGKKTGLFSTWDECKENITEFKGAVYKSFSNKEDALDFLNDKEKEVKENTFAYVDGSYDPKTGNYSFGAVFVNNNKETRFKKMYEADEYSIHRNVAGEIKGAGFIIQYAIKNNIKELNLYYDYEGISKWYNGIWKANKPISMAYIEFAKKARNKIKVNFIKVKSHSNVYYNEIVDKLAKEALGIK